MTLLLIFLPETFPPPGSQPSVDISELDRLQTLSQSSGSVDLEDTQQYD